MKKKLHKLILFLLLCQLQVAAQTEGYNYEATLQPVDSSGFYNIVLTPEINAHLKTDYSDLRIVNDSGKWVPHLVRYANDNFCFLPLLYMLKINRIQNAGDYTDIITEGVNGKIRSLNISIKNTTAERFCNLTGSDDLQSWFTINDSILVKPSLDYDGNKSTIVLEFPPVDYKYYKIHILNNNKAPFNILEISAGPKNTTTPEAPFYMAPIENPSTKITQKDSSKISFLRIEQPACYHFNTFSFKTSGAKYFNRTAELYIPSSANHSFSNPGKSIEKFSISNNSTLEFAFLPLSNAKVFYILISNDDNPALKIEEVKTSVGYMLASVYLEKAKKYQLLMENSSASLPQYDLSLKDIPYKMPMPTVTIGKIISLKKNEIGVNPKDNSKKLIWLVIAVAAIALTFFTYRLVTDMNKSKS